ncbi:MAG: flagellar motor switch protein FliN [Leptospirales bacterium]
MGEASLSQDEIDALLMGAEDVDAPAAPEFPEPAPASSGGGSSAALGGVFNDAMATAANSATSLITKNVEIANVEIEPSDTGAMSRSTIPGSVVISITMGASNSTFTIEAEAAKKISMLMMGADMPPAELDEAYLSTLGELANTIASSMSNSLGGKFKDDLQPGVPDIKVYNSEADLPPFAGSNITKFTYDLKIEGETPTKLVHYIDAQSTDKWASAIAGPAAAPMAPPMNLGQPQAQPQAAPQQQAFGGMMGGAPQAQSMGDVAINPVNFPSLSAGGPAMAAGSGQIPSNIDLLMDVQMVLTVELGRTKKYVKDILGLGEGSIIELDKLAGEPVDLLVNGKLIAKGEVVVIDENFGVRVTDIVGPAERLARMTSG